VVLAHARFDVRDQWAIHTEEIKMIKRFLMDEQGLELSEYAVAAALVALATVAAFSMLSSKIATRITTLGNYIP
jgi:Flp pilus assembly pilin Flp